MRDEHDSAETPQDGELTSLLGDVEQGADGERESIGEMLDTLSNRGFGPLLLLPALLSISPLGAIPGMSVAAGSLILVVAVQMLFRNDHPWVPRRLEKISISRELLEKRIRQGRPWVGWAEFFISSRLEVLTTGAMHYVLAVSIILLALTMFPLALVPLGVFVPGLAIALLAAGLTVHDGVLVLAGLAIGGAAWAALIGWWPWS